MHVKDVVGHTLKQKCVLKFNRCDNMFMYICMLKIYKIQTSEKPRIQLISQQMALRLSEIMNKKSKTIKKTINNDNFFKPQQMHTALERFVINDGDDRRLEGFYRLVILVLGSVFISTVELRWLEHLWTMKICSRQG